MGTKPEDDTAWELSVAEELKAQEIDEVEPHDSEFTDTKKAIELFVPFGTRSRALDFRMRALNCERILIFFWFSFQILLWRHETSLDALTKFNWISDRARWTVNIF